MLVASISCALNIFAYYFCLSHCPYILLQSVSIYITFNFAFTPQNVCLFHCRSPPFLFPPHTLLPCPFTRSRLPLSRPPYLTPATALHNTCGVCVPALVCWPLIEVWVGWVTVPGNFTDVRWSFVVWRIWTCCATAADRNFQGCHFSSLFSKHSSITNQLETVLNLSPCDSVEGWMCVCENDAYTQLGGVNYLDTPVPTRVYLCLIFFNGT